MGRKIKYDTEGMPYQREFQDARDPKVYMSGGFGSGKTYALIMKMFWLMNINRRCPGGILAPSYKMYKRDVVPTIKDICRENGIRYKYHKSDMVWAFPDTASLAYAFTAEDEDSIKGPNLAWFVINEVTECSKLAVMMAIARVRLKKAILLQIAMSGTPDGFNWAYDYFIEKPRKDTKLIYADTRLNRHVADAYVGLLEESYDPLMQEQFIKGLFVNMKGKRAAWAFDRFRHTTTGIQKAQGLPVWVTMDFNVSPMAATLWNRIPLGMDENSPVLLRAFDEICIESSNTYEMCDELIEKLDDGDDVTVYPDPAGRARSTKSMNISDLDILKEAGFRNLKYKLTLSVKDCLNSLNRLYARDALLIDREKCPQTVADMEQCILKGDFTIDKSNEKRTHWLDGTKNMADYEFAIRRPSFREERIR